jgi:hypothetical protein
VLLSCLRTHSQIVAIGAASGSDDTKGASRVLLNVMRVINKGLLRTVLMSVCYGFVIAINGSEPAQLTPLTQLLMGGFQYVSLLTLVGLALYVLNAKTWKRVASLGDQITAASAKTSIKSLLRSASQRRSSLASVRSSRRSSAAKAFSKESLQRLTSNGSMQRQSSYCTDSSTLVVAVQPQEQAMAPRQHVSTAAGAGTATTASASTATADASTASAALQLEDMRDSDVDTPPQTAVLQTLINRSNNAAIVTATTATSATECDGTAPRAGLAAARRRSAIILTSNSDHCSSLAAVMRSKGAYHQVVPFDCAAHDTNSSGVAAGSGSGSHSEVAVGCTYQRLMGLLTSSSSRVSPTAEQAASASTACTALSAAAPKEPKITGKRSNIKPLSSVIERRSEDIA